MDFSAFSEFFKEQIQAEIAVTHRSKQHNIDKVDVERFSQMFERFANYDLKQEVQSFAVSILSLVLLVGRYAELFQENTFHEECQLTIKTALDSVLFVIEQTEMYSHIMGQLVSIIEITMNKFKGQFSFIQEILKVYAGCLSNIEKEVLEKIVHRSNKFIYPLANAVRDANETSFQAVVIEIVLKFSSLKTPLLETMFPQIEKSLIAGVANDYPQIRTILEELNKNSSNIFSINCTSIMLDHYQVPEFEGANSSNNIWLDVNLPLKRLSFFCTPGFLNGFTDTRFKFGRASNWEVLSFHVEDCLGTTYNNKGLRHLEIDIRIRMSKFNLFGELKIDSIRHLVIQIPKDSKKYDKFVKNIMPQLFSNFSPEDYVYTGEDEVITDDPTTNLSLKTSNDSKRQKVQHFTLRKTSETTERKISVLNNTHLDSTKSTNIIEEDQDEIQTKIKTAEFSKAHDTVEKNKRTCNNQKLLERSLSVISFTESLHAGHPKSQASRRNKTMKTKTSIRKKPKISAAQKKKKIPKPLKISVKASSRVLHSPSSETHEKEPSSKEEVLDDDEDLVVRNALQESLEFSEAKVKNWLITQMPKEKEEVLLEGGSPEFKIPEQLPVQYEGPPASNISSSQPLEQRITKWLSEEHYEPSEATKGLIPEKLSGRTESLLETLAKDVDSNIEVSQTITKGDEREFPHPMEANVIINDGKSKENNDNGSVNSDNSDAPLSQLAAYWKKDKMQIEAEILNEQKDSAACKQLQKPKKKAKILFQKQKKLSVINEQTLSSGTSKRDLEEDEIVKTTVNLSKPSTDNDKENHSPTSGSDVDYQETQRNEPFKGSADYLFGKLIANKNRIPLPKENVADSSVSKSKPQKRHLYNPNDLSYLNNIKILNQTDTEENTIPLTKEDVAGSSKSKTKPQKRPNPKDLSYLDDIKIFNQTDTESESIKNSINESPTKKVPGAPAKRDGRKSFHELGHITDSKTGEKMPYLEINERRRSSTKKAKVPAGKKGRKSSTKKEKVTAAVKKGRKMRIQGINVEVISKSKKPTTKEERKTDVGIGTQTPLERFFDDCRREDKEYKKKKKLHKKVLEAKKRNSRGKKIVISSPSTVSSSEPFGIPMETILRERERLAAKRLKGNDGTPKKINVISNIVIKEADVGVPGPSNEELTHVQNPSQQCCCAVLAKNMHQSFLAYLAHVRKCNVKVLDEENYHQIVEMIKSD